MGRRASTVPLLHSVIEEALPATPPGAAGSSARRARENVTPRSSRGGQARQKPQGGFSDRGPARGRGGQGAVGADSGDGGGRPGFDDELRAAPKAPGSQVYRVRPKIKEDDLAPTEICSTKRRHTCRRDKLGRSSYTAPTSQRCSR